jgi:hypothetical protein
VGRAHEIFNGAIGLFMNFSSHRRADFTDATEAAEVVLLALPAPADALEDLET